MAVTAAQLNVRFGTEGVAKTKGDIDSVGNAVNNADQKRRAFGAGMLGLGGIIGGVFLGATTASIGFNEQMANVNSIAQLTTDQLAELSDEVLAISTKTGQGPEVLAKGLYDIQSSGFAGAEGLHILEVAANSANAGLTTTEVSAKGLTAVLNAYGMSVEDVGHVSDVMFQTVNDGVITFEQLSNNMGNTLPLSNALGISFEELAAGYVLMTKSGVPAAQVETQMAALMRSAINPTEALTAAVQEQGYATVESLIATEGLAGFLDLLTTASGGTTTGLFDLLGTQESVNAAILLGGENAAAYNAEVVKMEESSAGLGATQKALDKQMESTAFSLRLLKTNIQAAAIAIGVQFEPVIRVVAKAMTAMIKVFLGISKPVQAVIAGITALIGVVAAGAGAWILFGSTISLIGSILATIALPILAIVAAVVGLYAAWQTNFLGIRDITADAANAIMGFLEPISEFLGGFMDAWNDTSEAVYRWGDTVDDIVPKMDLGERALRAFSAGLLAIGGDDTPAWLVDLAFGFDRLADSLQAGGLSGFVSQLGTELRNLVSGIDIGSVVVTIGGWIINAASDLWDTVTSWIMGGYAGAGDGTGGTGGGRAAVSLGAVLVHIGSWAKGIVTDIWPYVRQWAMDAMGAVASAAGTVWGVIVNIGSWAKGVVTDIWPYVKQWATDAMGAVASAAGTVWGVLVNIGSWAKGIVTDIWPFIRGWAEAAISGATSAAATIWNVLVNVGSWAKGTLPDLGTSVVEWAKAAAVGAHDIGTVTLAIGSILWQETADIFSGLAIWAAGMIGLQDFSSVATAIGEKITSAIADAIPTQAELGAALGEGINLATDIASWLTEQIEGVDWESVGSSFGTLFIDSLKLGTVGLPALTGNILASTLASIEDVDWGTVGTTFGDLFKAAINGLTAFLTGFGTKIGSELGTELGNIEWSTLATTIKDNLVSAISTLTGFATSLGATLGSEIGQALSNIDWGSVASTFKDKLTSSISTLAGFAVGLGAALQDEVISALLNVNWGSVASEFKNKLTSAISNLVGFAADLGGTLGSELLQALGNVDWGSIGTAIKNALIDAVKGTGQAIWDAIWGEINGGGGGGQEVIPPPILGFSQGGLTSQLAGLQALKDSMNDATAIAGTLKDAIASIGSGGQAATGDVKGAGGGGPFASLLAGIVSAQAQLATFVQTTIALMAGWQTGMVTIVAGFGTAITTSLSAPLMASLAVFASFAQSTIALMAGWGTGIRTIVTSTMTATSATISTGMASSRAAVQAGMAAIAASAAAGMAAFRNAVAAGMAASVAAVRSGVAQMVGVARAAAGSMAGAGQAIGRSLGQGIASGISSMIGSVAAAAANIVRAAVSAARSAGGISSPSKIMHDQIGLMLGRGVETGILDSLSGIGRAANQMVPALSGGYGGTVPLTARGSGGGIHIGTLTVNVPTTLNIPENVSDAQILRIIRINAAAQEQATRSALNAQGGRS